MSKFCFVTGKKPQFGNNVSHSNRKTKKKFNPNIHKLRFWLSSKNKYVKLSVSSKGLRIINKFGIDYVFSFFNSGVKYNFIWQKKINI